MSVPCGCRAFAALQPQARMPHHAGPRKHAHQPPPNVRVLERTISLGLGGPGGTPGGPPKGVPNPRATSSPCQFRTQAAVHFSRHRPSSRIPARTRPFPLFRHGQQPATNRVDVNVVDDRAQRFGAGDVPVVAVARLLKAVPQASPVWYDHPRQSCRRGVFPIPDRLAGDRFLQRL